MAGDGAAFIRHPALAELFAYWRSLSRDGGVPRRLDIDPVRLGTLLPHLQLLDLGATPDDLRYRLVGGTIVEAFGFEPARRSRSDIRRDHVKAENRAGFDETSRQTDSVGRQGLVAYTHDHMTSYARGHLAYARLLVPVSEDGGRITGVFGAIYHSGDGAGFWRDFAELHVEKPLADFGIRIA